MVNSPPSPVLVDAAEDVDYILGTHISNFVGYSEELEYYRIMNNYYQKNEIASALVKDINENGSAILRTDYELSDSENQDILTDPSMEKYIDKFKIEGILWSSVFYITVE